LEQVKPQARGKKIDPASPRFYVALAKIFLPGERSSAEKYRQKLKELSTCIDRQRMKQYPEFRKFLMQIGEKLIWNADSGRKRRIDLFKVTVWLPHVAWGVCL
jgi:hypothetical protein